MTEKQAYQISEIFGGEPWQSGGNVWLVTIYKSDGSQVVIGSDEVATYDSMDDFDHGIAREVIYLWDESSFKR